MLGNTAVRPETVRGTRASAYSSRFTVRLAAEQRVEPPFNNTH